MRYLKPRAQTGVHVGLLLLSGLALPVYPSVRWRPAGFAEPTLSIMVLLTATVGLPYFLLSSTDPCCRRGMRGGLRGRRPTGLFALSNAGSLIALISYPILVEPVFALRQAGVDMVVVVRRVSGVVRALQRFARRRGSVREVATDDGAAEKPGLRLYGMWLALPACASALLLAITNHLTQNIAAIPFLWVLPLSIYLLDVHPVLRGVLSTGAPYPATTGSEVCGAWRWRSGSKCRERCSIKLMVPVFALGLYVCCMACHGELARLKPHPRYLTQFYLSIAAGGAMGGIFVALIAPRVFRDYYELQLGMVLCAALILAAILRDGELSWFRSWKQRTPLVGIVFTVALAAYLGYQVRESDKGSRVIVRNFYGVLKVSDSGPEDSLNAIRTLTHGTIWHGREFLASLAPQPADDVLRAFYGDRDRDSGPAAGRSDEGGSGRAGGRDPGGV